MSIKRFLICAGCVCLLAGCTTPDTVTPEQIQIAKLRTELNRTTSDTRGLVNQVEDLNARCKSLESENASLRSMLSQTQSSVRDVSSRVTETQQGLSQLSKTSSRTEDIAALNKDQATDSPLVKVIQLGHMSRYIRWRIVTTVGKFKIGTEVQ